MNDDTRKKIESVIQSKPVAIFMKGTPEFPQCGFSNRAIQVLSAAGVQKQDLAHFDVLSDDSVREGVKEFSQWPTLPQVYIRGEFVGGSDIIMELYESGELQKMIENQ